MILGLSSIQLNQLLTTISLLQIVQQVRQIVLLINTTVLFLNALTVSIKNAHKEWCPNFVQDTFLQMILESNFVSIDQRS